MSVDINKIKFTTEYLETSNKSNFILVSYFWGMNVVNKGSIYQYTYDKQVLNMIERCKRLNINHYFVYIKEFETIGYQTALGYKFDFIDYCMEKFTNFKNVVFIDTDMKILKYPVLLEKEADVFFVNWNTTHFECFNILQLELPGAILGFGNNPVGRKILKTAMKMMDKRYAEDKSLSGYFTRQMLNVFARCVWLPETYLFMFQEHLYEVGVGYKKLASYKKELKDHHLTFNDIVISHEDFETGELKDVYENRVNYDRYPPMTDKYMGEKLRCMVSKFDLYPQMTNNNEQLKQLEPMLEMYIRKDVANVYYLNLQSEFNKLYKRINIINDYQIYSYETQSNILVVHIINESEKDEYEYLLKKYEERGISYIVIDKEIMIDIPTMLLLIMEIYKTKNILLMGDIKEYNVDFVNLYEKNEWIDFSCYNYVDKCSDYRILYTKTLYPMYIKNIEMTTIFLLIWSTYNTKQFKNIEHKSLEYCLNKTISVNEMRCQWLYTKTLEQYLPIEYLQSIHLKHYKTPKKVDTLRKLISQCGLKPERNDNGFLRTHFKGSRYVDINYKYENFLFEL